MTRITADWLTAPASKTVTDTLQNAGFEVYFVGGCVRNALIDMPVSDLDLTTNARPDKVVQLMQDAGLKTIPTGLDHGTITVVSGGQPFEVTTYRKDIETDGRHATVQFSDTLHDDAVRRDFTMNALYCAPDGTVTDPVGGIPDLRAGHVRFIDDAQDRIREDYLRILRFFRFYAWFGDPETGLDADGLAACAANLDGLDGLARERVQTELTKTLAAPDPAPAMAAMAMSGVLMRLLPGADAMALAPLVHIETALKVAGLWQARLATLGVDDTVHRLRLSKADAALVDRIREAAVSGQNAGALGYALGADHAVQALMVRGALTGTMVSADDIELARSGASQIFPVKAVDLMPGYQGPALGARLASLESAWINSGFTLSREDLLSRD